MTAPRLVILDALPGLLSHGTAGQDAVLDTLAGLADLARTYSVAIVGVCHLAKARASRIIYRVRGTLSFVAAARAVHLVSAIPDAPDHRIVVPIKSIHGALPPPLTFRIQAVPVRGPSPLQNVLAVPLDHYWPIESAPHVQWEPLTTCRLSPEALDAPPEVASSLAEACAWLAACLASAPRPVREILAEARDAGLHLVTVRRAKRLLAVRSVKPHLDTPWLWSLESDPPAAVRSSSTTALPAPDSDTQGLDNKDDQNGVSHS